MIAIAKYAAGSRDCSLTYECEFCQCDLIEDGKFLTHPEQIDTGFFREKLVAVECPDAGKKFRNPIYVTLEEVKD